MDLLSQRLFLAMAFLCNGFPFQRAACDNGLPAIMDYGPLRALADFYPNCGRQLHRLYTLLFLLTTAYRLRIDCCSPTFCTIIWSYSTPIAVLNHTYPILPLTPFSFHCIFLPSCSTLSFHSLFLTSYHSNPFNSIGLLRGPTFRPGAQYYFPFSAHRNYANIHNPLPGCGS